MNTTDVCTIQLTYSATPTLKKRKQNNKHTFLVGRAYVMQLPILVNIYFEFYGLSECSISRKFYETHVEVFKSLH